MENNKKQYVSPILYLMVVIIPIIGFLVYRLNLENSSKSTEIVDEVFVTDKTETIYWLHKSSVNRLILDKNTVKIGANFLPFKKDTIGKSIFFVPLKEAVWKNYLITYLDNNKDFTEQDSTMIWQNTRAKIINFGGTNIKQYQLLADWSKLSDVQQACHILINKLAKSKNVILSNESFIELPNNLPQSLANSESYHIQKKSEPNKQLLILLYGLLMFVFASVVFKIYQTKKMFNFDLNDKSEEIIIYRQVNIPIPENTKTQIYETPKVETSEVELYLKMFRERYGSLYADLQNVKEKLSEEQKQKIRQQLIEMGLHAYSFSEAYAKSGDIKNIQNFSLNVHLILNGIKVPNLNSSSYILFDSHPEKTEISYRNLHKVIREMNIGCLDGVLLNDKYFIENKFLV